MRVVYIAHPLGAGPDRETNRAKASRWVAWAAEQGIAPVADWIILSGQWDESRREQGLAIDFVLIERCHELWMVGGRISAGMLAEAGHAKNRGIFVRDLTALGGEPPTDPDAFTKIERATENRVRVALGATPTETIVQAACRVHNEVTRGPVEYSDLPAEVRLRFDVASMAMLGVRDRPIHQEHRLALAADMLKEGR